MKEKYESPVMEIYLMYEDMIRTSGFNDVNTEDEGEWDVFIQ